MRRSFVLVLLFAGMMAAEAPAEAGGLAYVLSNGSNLLTIFDVTTKTAPRSLTTGSQPATLLIHPNNRLAFVSNSADNTVTFYDLSPGQEQVLGTVATDSVPGDLTLSLDGKTLYVANEGSNDVTVIDVISHSVLATIPVGVTPVALNISPDGRTVYAVNTDSGTLSLIDTATNTVRSTLTVGSKPNQFAISPDLRFGYVVNTVSNNVTQIDLASNTVVQTIPVGTNPVSIAFSPDSSKIYAINQGSNNISLVQVEPSVQTLQPPIAVDRAPVAMALTSDGSFGFVANSGSDTVSVIDFRVNQLVDTVQLPAGSKPFAITLDPNEDFIYATNLGSNTVDVINASTDQLLSQPAVGQAPTQFSFLNSPSLLALQPASGLAGGTIVVQGEGFVPDSMVLFATSPATTGFLEHDILRATVPPQLGVGSVNVLVQNPDLSTTDLASFRIVSAPAVSSGGVTPSQGPTTGQTQVSIAGSGFQNGAVVSFAGRLGTVLAQGSTSLTATTPPGPPGSVDVAVVNPDGTRAVLNAGFTYVAQPASLLQLSDTSVQFVVRSGETRPLSQSLGVMNIGTDTLNWTATVALTNAAPTNWLSVSPTSGGAPQTLVVRADPTGLPAGVFTGNITVGATPSQVFVSVTLTILATTSTNLVLPHVADGRDPAFNFATTLILLNPNDADAHATVLFRDDDGVPLRLNFTDGESGDQLNLTVPARGARFLTTDGSSSIVTVGSAEVSSDLPIGGTAIFRQRVSGRPDFEAAVALVAPVAKLVLSADDAGGFASGLAVMNTNDQMKSVQLRIRDTSGLLLGQIFRNVPPRGHFSEILRDLLPTVVGLRTTIEMTTTDGSRLAAVGIRANPTGALTTLPVIDPYAPSAQSFVAHVIDGTTSFAWRTSFLIVNPADFSATTTMNFFGDTGAAFALGFVSCPTNCSTGSSFTFPISPLGLLALQTNASNTTNEWGQGQVTSTLPVGGTAIFLQQVSGRPDFEAAVPLVQPASDLFLAVDNSAGFSTGIAIGNATAQAGTLTLIFRDETGTIITSQPPVPLAASGHTAFILTDLMPAAAQRRGVLEIITPTGVSVTAIAIRANLNTNSSGALTTLPVLTR